MRINLGGVLAGIAVVLSISAPASAADKPSTLPIEAYGKLPAIESPRLSPDGSKLAFLSSAKNRRCLVVKHLDDKHPGAVVCPGKYEVRWFSWKTDSRLILELYTADLLSAADQRTESRLVALDVDGSHMKGLSETTQERAADFGQNQVISMLPDDPDNVLISVYRSNNESPDVLRVNVYSGLTESMVKGQRGITSWKTDSKGTVRVGVSVKDGVIRTYYRDDDQSDFRLIHTEDVARAANFSVLAVSDKPGLIYVASAEKTGRRAVYAYDARAGRFLDMYAGRADIDIDTLMIDHGEPIGYGYTDDEAQLVFSDPVLQSDADRIAAALPNLKTYVVDETTRGRRLLILASGGNRPGSYYLLTREEGTASLSPVGSIRPQIPDSTLSPVKPVTYRARDGLEIRGYLTLPQGVISGPIPFVIMPHGGPSTRDTLGFDYIAQMIASRGYGVLQPNYRGSRGFGAAFEQAGFQQWGLAMQDDLTDGTRWLIDQKLADPSRICIVGWSYGGYAALMGAIKTPELFRCAASMAGVTDLHRRLDRASNSRFADLNVPRFDSDPSIIAANTPLLHADQIRIPVLLAHGRRDFTVPVADSEAMEAALRQAGKSVRALYFANDDHYFFREGDRISYLKALERFLKENLGAGATAQAMN